MGLFTEIYIDHETKDPNEILDALDNLTLDSTNNPDCEEPSLLGMATALKYALPRSYLFLFTDDIAKDVKEYGDKVIKLIQQKQITVN